MTFKFNWDSIIIFIIITVIIIVVGYNSMVGYVRYYIRIL